ncbi:MAG: M48 family metalloprotease [Acidimicrobiales bacterium]
MSGLATFAVSDRLATGRARARGVIVRAGAVLVAAAVLLGLVVGVLVAWWVGLAAAALALAALWVNLIAAREKTAEARVLRLVGSTRPADPLTDARFHNLVEGLAPSAGLPRPSCVVAEDPAPNALAVGHNPRHGCVVVTTGLLELLSRMELEAVVAHALVRLRDGVTMAPTLALALGGGGPLYRWTLQAGSQAGDDLEAVRLTRYPPGLISALRALGPARAPDTPWVPSQASPLLAPLWLVAPDDPHSVDVRIAALEEL